MRIAAQRVAIAGRAFGWIATDAVERDLSRVMRDERPDLVIAEILDFGAGLAAQLAGVPRVIHSYGRFLDGADLMSAMADQFGLCLRSRGVEGTLADFIQQPRYLDVCPPSLQSPQLVAER